MNKVLKKKEEDHPLLRIKIWKLLKRKNKMIRFLSNNSSQLKCKHKNNNNKNRLEDAKERIKNR